MNNVLTCTYPAIDTVLAYNSLADGLRDVLSPVRRGTITRMRNRREAPRGRVHNAHYHYPIAWRIDRCRISMSRGTNITG
jgi:hypothetical protein